MAEHLSQGSAKVDAPLKVWTDVTICASLAVNDPEVLNLTRGEAWLGRSFNDQNELLEHLAVNLIGEDLRLSQLDGWADLPDEAVTTKVFGVDVELSRG